MPAEAAPSVLYGTRLRLTASATAVAALRAALRSAQHSAQRTAVAPPCIPGTPPTRTPCPRLSTSSADRAQTRADPPPRIRPPHAAVALLLREARQCWSKRGMSSNPASRHRCRSTCEFPRENKTERKPPPFSARHVSQPVVPHYLHSTEMIAFRRIRQRPRGWLRKMARFLPARGSPTNPPTQQQPPWVWQHHPSPWPHSSPMLTDWPLFAPLASACGHSLERLLARRAEGQWRRRRLIAGTRSCSGHVLSC